MRGRAAHRAGRDGRGAVRGPYLFVDETKASQYTPVVAAVAVRELDAARSRLRGQIRSGQRSLHFKQESDRSRRAILSAIREIEIDVSVYRAPRGMSDFLARELAMRAVAIDACKREASLIVIDQDDSLLKHDRRWLSDELRAVGAPVTLRYHHKKRHEEPLLAMPDAIAWCLQRGRPWAAMVRPFITATSELLT